MVSRSRMGQAPGEDAMVRQRLKLAGIIALILAAILLARLYSLQVSQYARYQTLSLDNHIRLQALSPVRGLILDRNGVVLAQNTAVYALKVTPERVPDMDLMLAEVGQIVDLSDREILAFKQRSSRRPGFKKQLLKTQLDDAEAAKFAVNEYRFPGVTLEAVLHRDYPFAELTAHFLGYVGRISEKDQNRLEEEKYKGISHTGKSGIEKQYERALVGSTGFEEVEIDAHGRTLRTISREGAIPGDNLRLTIDIELQREARRALGASRGAVVAMDPNNGEVLAMVSNPSFDPNLFVDGIDHATYSALRSLKDKPFLNRALHGRYAPGSTIKPIFAEVVIEEGIDPEESVFCPGWYMLPGSTRQYRCWKKTGHGRVDLHAAIEQSCDVYFYEMGKRLGIGQMSGVLKKFGLGSQSGVDLPGEPDGLVPSAEWKLATRNEPWYPGEDLITAIGQGFLMTTPLQLARVASILANRGSVVQPRLLMSKNDPLSGEPEELNNKKNTRNLHINTEAMDRVIRAMTAVMSSPRGTARMSGRRSAYSIAGKTGTAQVIAIAQGEEYDEDSLKEEFRDHALFIAFAPVENPKIAIAVVVENGGSGAGVAAPVARKVLDHFFLKALERA
ncbi:MAG: penicillin-binding protein 2 [Proteobacteria bacterium]|nr:penicillin-binding protein 2 [Pseudomonadota bacterium]MBT7110992.1 penicillin-binding protein 2 [Pseudomonadota bacterium]MBT7813685.1 penicillin-binding protein 2 [Pseudomonadota bacterium]